ncbi:MAG: TrkH family potassium uptake protein, partial [Bacteroidetes bacterium]
EWDWISIFFIVSFAMFIGGASGATVGGIKMIRALLIQRVLRLQIMKAFLSEKTVKTVKFDGRSLLPEEVNEEFTRAASLAIMFLVLVIGSSLAVSLISGEKYTFTQVLFESASAQGTVGLSAGITDPGMSPVAELIYIFQMWAGRLEIIPVLALVRAVFRGVSPRII